MPTSIYVSRPSTVVLTRGAVNETIDCNGNANPKPTVVWKRSSGYIRSVKYHSFNDTRNVVQVISDDISQPLENVTSRLYLRTAGVTYEEAGNYTCEVFSNNSVQVKSRSVEVLCKSYKSPALVENVCSCVYIWMFS